MQNATANNVVSTIVKQVLAANNVTYVQKYTHNNKVKQSNVKFYNVYTNNVNNLQQHYNSSIQSTYNMLSNTLQQTIIAQLAAHNVTAYFTQCLNAHYAVLSLVANF